MKNGQHMMPMAGGKSMPMMDKTMARSPKRKATRSKRRDQSRKPSRGSGRY